MADGPTYESIHAQVLDERTRDARAPVGIRLGAAQMKVIDRFHREAGGLSDVGPLTQFAGLEVLPSRAEDKVEIVWADTPPEDLPPPPVPSGPDAPEQPPA